MSGRDALMEQVGFSGKKFGRYLWGVLVKPRQTLRQIQEEKVRLSYGLAAVLLFSIWYGIAVLAG